MVAAILLPVLRDKQTEFLKLVSERKHQSGASGPVQNANPFVTTDRSHTATTGNTAVLPGVPISLDSGRRSGSTDPCNSVFV